MGIIKNYILIINLIFVLALTMQAVEAKYVISNSADWRDVYSTLNYAKLETAEGRFLTSTRHSTILLYAVPREQDVEIISSQRNPYVVGYDSIVESRGFKSATEDTFSDVNLGLAQKLTGVNKFVIVDDSYGYNALSVAPYAAASRSYVLFADEDNIDDIADYLSEITNPELILYGQLDREVKNELAQYNPEVINKGDRFENNIEIVKKYQEIAPSKQTILSSGEFIEQSMMNGNDPVLFIGRDNVPDSTREYIQGSDIEVGVLIGNELIGTATFIRRTVGISVFVKFAQGSRVPSAAISPVEDLDRFPMPRYFLNLSIFSANYNQGTKSLEVTYQNNVELATYMKSTITVSVGDEFFTLGDDDAIFIDGEDFKTIVYDKTTSGDPIEISGTNASAQIFTIFGESPKSLEFTLEQRVPINFVTVLDDTDIEIVDLVYDKRGKNFEVKIKNNGEDEVYVNPEIIEILINGEPVTLGAESTELLDKGKSKWIKIPAELDDEDIEENEVVRVRANYGQRETALIKQKEEEFEIKFKSVDYVTYGLILVVIILILLFLFGRKKKCKHCGHKNPKKASHCQRCNNSLADNDVHHQTRGGRGGHAHHTMHRTSHTKHHAGHGHHKR